MWTMSPISPFFRRLYWSRYQGCERRCAPDFTVSLSSLRFLRSRHETSHARGVRAHRLLAEDVLLRLHRRLEMQRAVAGVRRQHDDIHVAGHQLLVRVEADEAVLGIHLEAAGKLRLQGPGRADRVFHAVFENVRHGDDLHVVAAGEDVLHGLRAAASAADQPGLQFLLARPRTNSGLMIWKAVAAPMLDARKDLRDSDSFIIHDLRTTYSIMQITSMELGDYTHQPDLARASTIPARWYTDPAMLEAERRHVFARTWQAAGLAAWAPRPGTYFACEIAGEPVLVTRAADGVLRAFSNVCRHRGSELCTGQNSGTVIHCPYHGWTYTLDGRLHGAPEFEGVDNWDRSRGLPARVPGRNLGTVRLRQHGRRRAAARRSDGRDSRARSPNRLPDRPPAPRLSPRLRHRVQLEGLRRQLPGGLPPAGRASQPLPRAGLRAVPRRDVPLLLVADRADSRRRRRRDAPLRIRRRRAAARSTTGSFPTSCSTSIRTI